MTKRIDPAKVVLNESNIYDETTEPSRYMIPPTLSWHWMAQMEPPCWGFRAATVEEQQKNSVQYYKERACINAEADRLRAEEEEQDGIMFEVPIPQSEEIFTVEVPA